MKKVVITKAEVLSSLGKAMQALHANLPLDPPAATTVQDFEFHKFDSPVACFKVKDVDPVEILGKKGLRTKDWSTKLLLSALEIGLKDLLDGAEEKSRPGICVGTAFGSVDSIGNFLSESIVSGVNNVNPQAFANTVINACTSYANVRFVARALSCTVATGFNASLDAMIYAHDHLQRGYLDWIVAGGLEEVSYYSLLGMQRTGVLSSRGESRPFCTGSDGFVAGEGCALFVLETEEHARARGATPIAEIVGACSAFDPSDSGAASGESARYAFEEACRVAQITPDRLGFVAASANGVPALDEMEARLLTSLCPSVPVTAYKRYLGECYGAAAALSTACALSDMENRRVTGVGAGCHARGKFNLVTTSLQGHNSEFAAVNAFSCDGNCGSIIFKRL